MLEEDLIEKIKTLNLALWEDKARARAVEAWLENFASSPATGSSERLHALFLLSNFMYFGSAQMRELMRSLFRDLYRYPVIQQIRQGNSDTLDRAFIDTAFQDELKHTRFLGVGNPSESGCHLLYYFRQENGLPKTPFIHSHEIFDRRGAGAPASLRDSKIRRYVFIDDFCGSGKQGVEYSQQLVEDIKRLAPNAIVSYHVLFAVADGVRRVRDETHFDDVQCIFELDATFKCFHPSSRYFTKAPPEINQGFAESMCRRHGGRLWSSHPLGYDDCQLLIGFHHNTPDNSLPVLWADSNQPPVWTPIFRRYPKVYGW